MLVLLSAAWFFEEASQWLLRYRTARLFGDFRGIAVNRSSSSEIQTLLRKWSPYGEAIKNCDGDPCHLSFLLPHRLPAVFHGNPEEGSWNLLPRLADHLGLRNEGVGISFTIEHGIVTRKSFGEVVALPIEQWFARRGAYVPELNIWTGETVVFDEQEELYVRPSHPFRVLHNQKGPYGVLVTFTPEESLAEQEALMNFQFSCLTRLLPCLYEGDVLPESDRMLEEEQRGLSMR